ncbi:MAG: hypothetical protein DHS20C11_00010 [Lysobacteraceae bacterium]|nr:MAG: hypothetical protein DHS20C11_00010 [Xanthomonadaceae bacterium]
MSFSPCKFGGYNQLAPLIRLHLNVQPPSPNGRRDLFVRPNKELEANSNESTGKFLLPLGEGGRAIGAVG